MDSKTMKCIATIFLFSFFFAVLLCSTAYGQAKDNRPEDISLGVEDRVKEAFLSELLQDPETINAVIERTLGRISPLHDLLEGANIRFKTFESDSSDSPSALGISYSYSKSLGNLYLQDNISTQYGFDFSVDASGNVAFNQSKNPNDFLESSASANFFRSTGGAVEVGPELQNRINQLTTAAAQIDDIDELNESEEWQELTQIVRTNLRNQFYTSLGLDVGLESNQNFDQYQFVYGIQFGFDPKAWNPNSFLARANVFDYPFALIRFLSGDEATFSPRGSALPTFLVALQRVEPQEDDPRVVAGDDSGYNRFSAEIGFKTFISRFENTKAHFEANFRHYTELSATEEIVMVDLDKSTFFTAALVLSNGMFASYSVGKLPLDMSSDQVYALGFNYEF